MGLGTDLDAALKHYETLFPRQERLDLEQTTEGGVETQVASPAPAAITEPEIPFTWSEQHRRECEARHVMKLPLGARREYYRHVADKRGEPAMHELIAEVNRQWKMANSL